MSPLPARWWEAAPAPGATLGCSAVKQVLVFRVVKHRCELSSHHRHFLSDGPNWVLVPAALFAEIKALGVFEVIPFCLWLKLYAVVPWNLICFRKWAKEYAEIFIYWLLWFFLQWLVGTRENVLVSLVLTCSSLLCCVTLCYGERAQGMCALSWTARPLACFPLPDGPVICIYLGDVAILRE